GRGLASALAGWQLSRRPMRGAGPVLLLVLATALGMLAVGQGASWDRSQDDQADFRAGAPVRVLASGTAELGRTETYAAVPGVREAAPAVRTSLQMSGDRTATVLALDTAGAADAMLLRPDLSPVPARSLLSSLAPEGEAAGAKVPAGTARLALTATLGRAGAGGATGMTADVTVTAQDRDGVPYRLPAGALDADGRGHTLELPVSSGPLTVTGVELVMAQPSGRAQQHRFTLEALTATSADGTVRKLELPRSWTATARGAGQVSPPDAPTSPTRPRLLASGPPRIEYGTGYVPADTPWETASLTVRLDAAQPAPPQLTAVATDRFLDSTGARARQPVDIALDGRTVTVRITHTVHALPTTTATDAPLRGTEKDGGALLVDLRSVNRVLQARYGESVTPTEWWLRTAPGKAAGVAAALRAFPDVDPAQVVVRDELAGQLRDDPFGAGPGTAFT
ncbi:ABC transporter permease, partial [Streptomyces sp. SID5910]|nr:ABC transporter permease [Streptomyces sp. SID5910]